MIRKKSFENSFNRVFNFNEKLLNSKLDEKDNEIIELWFIVLDHFSTKMYCECIIPLLKMHGTDFEITPAHTD